MLPMVILQNEVPIAPAAQLVLNVFRDVRHLVKAVFDALALLNKPQKVRVPVSHVDTDFLEIAWRNCFDECGIHSSNFFRARWSANDQYRPPSPDPRKIQNSKGASPKRKRRFGAAPLFGDVVIRSQESAAKTLLLALTAGQATTLGTLPANHAKHTKRIRAHQR